MKTRLIGAAIVLLIGLAALTLRLLAEFADIPCQDGVWDEVRKTCVPS